jgi:hypothetical protein
MAAQHSRTTFPVIATRRRSGQAGAGCALALKLIEKVR